MTKLHSYLNFAGNAEEAFGFYKSGRLEMPIADQVWGDYYGGFEGQVLGSCGW
jgi:uncharacterized glyoxalase superfamily protein PhnB